MPTLPGPMVTVAWLRQHATHRPLRIVDLRWSLTPPSGRQARPVATGPNPMGEPA